MIGHPASDSSCRDAPKHLQAAGPVVMESPGWTSSDDRGFTLLELAIVIVLVGLLTGGGLLIASRALQNRMRADALSYMQEVEKALLTYASVNGRLPLADTTGDGRQNAYRYGGLPYADLGVRPKDPWGRQLRYEANGALDYSDKTVNCNNLKGALGVWPSINTPLGFQGRPFVADGCPQPARAGFTVTTAFIIISAGANGSFDAVFPCGNNAYMAGGQYIRHPLTDKFDDLLIYVGEAEIYSVMKCGTAASPP